MAGIAGMMQGLIAQELNKVLMPLYACLHQIQEDLHYLAEVERTKETNKEQNNE